MCDAPMAWRNRISQPLIALASFGLSMKQIFNAVRALANTRHRGVALNLTRYSGAVLLSTRVYVKPFLKIKPI
jgi:hypothetical protein